MSASYQVTHLANFISTKWIIEFIFDETERDICFSKIIRQKYMEKNRILSRPPPDLKDWPYQNHGTYLLSTFQHIIQQLQNVTDLKIKN